MIARQLIIDSQNLVEDIFHGFHDELMGSYGAINHTLKEDNSQVTELDLKVEETLRDQLATSFPDLGFQGEETGAQGSREAFWLVDPIDGTLPYIRGLPYCTNMGALIVDNQAVASVIYNFVTDDMYTARLGEGAYKNGQPIHVSKRPVGESFLYVESSAISDVRSACKGDGVKIIAPFAASGYFFVIVAEGKVEGCLKDHGFGKSHDYAPGALLVREAGGVIVTAGGDYQYDTLNFVACTPQFAKYVKLNSDKIWV